MIDTRHWQFKIPVQKNLRAQWIIRNRLLFGLFEVLREKRKKKHRKSISEMNVLSTLQVPFFRLISTFDPLNLHGFMHSDFLLCTLKKKSDLFDLFLTA